MSRHSKLFVALVVWLLVSFSLIIFFFFQYSRVPLSPQEEKETTTCPQALPNTDIPQDDAIQQCLDTRESVILSPGTYLIAKGLVFTKDNTILTSLDPNNRAKLIADPNLARPLVNINERIGVTIDSLIVDGNRLERKHILSCVTDHIIGYNIIGERIAYLRIHNVAIINALCGTGILLVGNHFEVSRSYIAHNGFANGEVSRYATRALEHQYADGLTIGNCDHGYIHHNVFEDNTDVNLIIGGGESCRVVHNTIRQTSRFARAGLWLFNFTCSDCGKGDHRDSYYAFNTITASSPGTLRAGIVVGAHLANSKLLVRGGTVASNTVTTGNSLLVDGVTEATIMNNYVGKSTSEQCGGNQQYGYTVGHTTSSMLQSGWMNKTFDEWSCQSPNEHIETVTNNAAFVSQSVPLIMTSGKIYAVSISFRNTGTTTWQSGSVNGYSLGSQNPQDNTLWRTKRVPLENAEFVDATQAKTFTFLVTAPSMPGKYPFQWQMVHEGVQWFGDKTPSTTISVQ